MNDNAPTGPDTESLPPAERGGRVSRWLGRLFWAVTVLLFIYWALRRILGKPIQDVLFP